MSIGVYVVALGTIAAGVMDLVWGDFEAAHQPIQAFGDHIPGRAILAYVTAVWMIAAGGAVLWRRTARAGAALAALVYCLFAVFWLPRLYTAPHYLGVRIPVFIGVLVGVGQQLILVAAALVLYVTLSPSDSAWRHKAPLIARWTFGLSAIDFGLAHLTGVSLVAAMVPKWIPLGGDFWAVITGIGFVLAGLAILARVQDVLAARLLALMLLAFSALALPPLVAASPHDHVAWGSNAYNLAAAGGTWIFAESIIRPSSATF